MKRRWMAPAAAAVFVLPALLGLLAAPAAAEPVVPGLNVTGPVTFKDASFILTQDVLVQAGGTLTLDNVSVQFRFILDESREIRVLPGGTLIIVNGSRIYSQFVSPAFSLHYRVWIAPGGHFVFQNSTLDYAYWVGVGDEDAVLEDSTISHSLLGLFGYNLTVTRMTFFSTNVGMWLSGHSVVRDSRFEVATVYGAILDGTSRVETSYFTGSETADLMLMENASAVDNVHRFSVRAAIMNQNSSIVRPDIAQMTAAGVQVGAEDLRYGCGIYIRYPRADWLNLRQMTWYQRWDNDVTIEDMSVRQTPTPVALGMGVWRIGNITQDTDPCDADPPPQQQGAPLLNRVTMRVTRSVALEGSSSEFNGSIVVESGGSLALRGVDMRFYSPGSTHTILVQGGALLLENVRMSTAFVDYARNELNASDARAPPLDILVDAGSLTVRNSTLRRLGSSADPSADAGIIVREGAGPVEITDSTILNSTRGITLGCCGDTTTSATAVTVERSSLAASGPALAMRGGAAFVTNSTIASTAAAAVVSLGEPAELHLYGTLATPQGPSPMRVYRYGFVQARAVWEDLRPAAGAVVNVSDFPGGSQIASLPTGADGWITPQFLLYSTTLWDGVSEQGQGTSLFTFRATVGGATVVTLPSDISLGATFTLALPDESAPTISLDLPEIFFTNVSGGVVTGLAEDFETGITVVELSVDGGPFLSVLTPSAPLLGPVNYTFTLSGLSENLHVLLVRAWDSVGNTAEASAYFVVDLRFPTLRDFNFDILTNKRLFNVTGKLNEGGSVTIKGNTTNVSALDGSFSLPLYLDLDSEYIMLSVRDLAGNAHDYPFVVRFDGVPPQLSVTSPQNGSWTTQANTTVSGTIEFNAELALNGVPLSVSGTTAFTIRAALTEGENLLTLTATDAAGNRRQVSVTVYFDPSPPLLDILGPDPFQVLGSPNVTLRLRTDPGAVVTVANTTVTASSELVEIPLHLAEGRNLLSISVSDLAGNTVLRGLTLNVDTTAPTIVFVRGETDATSNVTYFLRGLTEPNAVVVIGGYASQADAQGGFSVPLHLHGGANVIPVTARDAAGNQVFANFTVTVAVPPLAGDPGYAAPGGGPMALLLVGLAAAVALPLAARAVARRRM